jgi:hypothetical protein
LTIRPPRPATIGDAASRRSRTARAVLVSAGTFKKSRFEDLSRDPFSHDEEQCRLGDHRPARIDCRGEGEGQRSDVQDADGGLWGGPIGAHFHGPVSYLGLTPEENAPIQVGTPGNLASPFHGVAKIDDTQAKDLKDGRYYFNLHSTKIPAGEIRVPVVRR